MPSLGRKDLRREYPVVVRARCGGCQRVIAECYGERHNKGMRVLYACWSESGPDRGLVRVIHPDWWAKRIVRWGCRCGADYPISGLKLYAAFAVAAAGPTKRDRVIVLPGDLALPADFLADLRG